MGDAGQKLQAFSHKMNNLLHSSQHQAELIMIIRRVIITTMTITSPSKSLLSLFWSYLSREPFKLGRLAVGGRIIPLLKKLCTHVRMILTHALFCLTPDNSTEAEKKGQYVAKNYTRSGMGA